MEKIKFSRLLPIIFIAVIGISIYLTNLSGNFWFTGWDNLHPEFNFAANIKRSLFSSWQEYQGLGLPAGNGHATEFFRELLLFIISLIVPLQTIRKIYALLMILAGPFGVFFLLKNVFLKDFDHKISLISSFFGAVFYLLHIATVQIFYLPYEAFMTHYGLMPWMIYSVYRYAYKTDRKNLFFLIVIHLLGTAQFYIPPLFIVYGFLLGVILISLIKKVSWQKILTIILLVLLCNLFWILPFLYYSINNIGSQLNAYSNLLYSLDIYLKNVEYGGLIDTLLLKGFLFSFTDQISPQNYGYLMEIWRNYFNNPWTVAFGLSLFSVVIVGIITNVRKKSNYALIILFIIFFSLIAINTFPFRFLNDILRKSSLFDQVFRNPFTKFSNSLLLIESIFFAFGIQALTNLLKKLFKTDFFIYFFMTIIFLLQVIIVLPVWQGNFIYPNLKVAIPKEYFDLFDYFKNQGDGRIANFPQYSPSGWEFYNWGYRGSGFLWYGIEQPILDRAFDVWDKNSENYFWEIYKATYSNDPIQTENVLTKYDVKWLIVDNNVVSGQALDKDKLADLLNKIPDLSLVGTFGNVNVYEFNNATNKEYTSLDRNLPNISPIYQWNDYDTAFAQYKTYVTDDKNVLSSIYYPFRTLFTGRGKNEDGLEITQDSAGFIVFSEKIPASVYGDQLIIPKIDAGEITDYDKNNLLKTSLNIPSFYINDSKINLVKDFTNKETVVNLAPQEEQTIKIVIPKTGGYYSYDSNNDNSYLYEPLKSCDQFQNGKIDKKIVPTGLELISTGNSNCFDISLSWLSQKYGYLILIKNQNLKGRGLFFSLFNNAYNSSDSQNYLNTASDDSYFIIPPRERYGLGYNLHFDNYSLGEETSDNIISHVGVNPIPYRLLTDIKVVKNSYENHPSENLTEGIEVNHPNYFTYSVKTQDINTDSNSTLTLYQSYNSGWIAITNGKILPHVLVNNWANGWKLVKTSSTNSNQPSSDGLVVTIIFWPQYLEFAGLGLLALVIIILLFKEKYGRKT